MPCLAFNDTQYVRLKTQRFTNQRTLHRGLRLNRVVQLHRSGRLPTIATLQRTKDWNIAMIEIGSRNNAPTPQHKSHDVYLFSIDLSQPATPFCFEQSIGGGHAEQGGARWLALDELDAWPGQCREHLKKADCAWVVELLDTNPDIDQATLVSMILKRHAEPGTSGGRLKAIGGWLKRNIHVGGRYGL